MRRSPQLVDRRLAKALAVLQAMMIPVAALLAGLIADATAAKSAALGALVYWLASSFFGWQAFKSSGARASRQIVSNMYLGLIGKFVIVIVGLILILSSISLSVSLSIFRVFRPSSITNLLNSFHHLFDRKTQVSARVQFL